MACAAVRVRWICVSKPVRLFLWEGLTFLMAFFQHCIMSLCGSTLSELGLQLLVDLFALKDSSYWLVRTELLESLAEMDFR